MVFLFNSFKTFLQDDHTSFYGSKHSRKISYTNRRTLIRGNCFSEVSGAPKKEIGILRIFASGQSATLGVFISGFEVGFMFLKIRPGRARSLMNVGVRKPLATLTVLHARTARNVTANTLGEITDDF